MTSTEALPVILSESRYDRQERVTWWDQCRLADARVLVAGAGALGNEVVKNLVLVGVGDIVVVDMDRVEHSNLARCVFFRAEDEGRPKAEALAERAAALNPGVAVTGLVADLRTIGSGVAERADVLVGALDNREARLYLNRLASRTRRPWVDGAIEGLQGLARVFWPPEVCYECTLSDRDWEHLAHRQSCRLLRPSELVEGKVPTTAPTSSIVAAVEAQEVIKLLHADVEGVRPLRGALVFDGINNDTYPLSYPGADDCMAHHHFDDALRLDLDDQAWAELTGADLAAAAWGDDPATVDLGDDHVAAWECKECGSEEPAGVLASQAGWEDAECPDCGSARMPEVLSSICVPGPDAHRRLADLGVRRDEFLCVRSGLDERHVWLAAGDSRFPASWLTQRGGR